MNFLHLAVLEAKTKKDLPIFKPMNVTKKMVSHNITPIHMACLNPNSDILQSLLNVK